MLNQSLRLPVTLILAGLIAGCGGGGGSDSGSGDSSSVCGTIGLSERIINGVECAPQDSAVVLVGGTVNGGTSGVSCSATMLTSRFALTAAHCFPSGIDNVYVSTYSVASRPVVNYWVHPNYTITSSTTAHDVAIVELATPATSLPTFPILTGTAVTAGDEIQIFGYGLDETQEDSSAGVIRGGTMTVSSVTSDLIVANFDGSGQNTCSGDSGGPALMFNGSAFGLVGVTSFGTVPACTAGDHSAFTNLQNSSNLQFIRSHVPGVSLL